MKRNPLTTRTLLALLVTQALIAVNAGNFLETFPRICLNEPFLYVNGVRSEDPIKMKILDHFQVANVGFGLPTREGHCETYADGYNVTGTMIITTGEKMIIEYRFHGQYGGDLSIPLDILYGNAAATDEQKRRADEYINGTIVYWRNTFTFDHADLELAMFERASDFVNVWVNALDYITDYDY